MQMLSKKTIVKVRGRVNGVWSKTILSRFLIFGPFPNTDCCLVGEYSEMMNDVRYP